MSLGYYTYANGTTSFVNDPTFYQPQNTGTSTGTGTNPTYLNCPNVARQNCVQVV